MPDKPEWDGTEVELVTTVTARYTVSSEYYEGATTLDEAMRIDVNAAMVDPISVYDEFDGVEVSWKKV